MNSQWLSTLMWLMPILAVCNPSRVHAQNNPSVHTTVSGSRPSDTWKDPQQQWKENDKRREQAEKSAAAKRRESLREAEQVRRSQLDAQKAAARSLQPSGGASAGPRKLEHERTTSNTAMSESIEVRIRPRERVTSGSITRTAAPRPQ